MELEGEVISIIYKNDINSYTIADFETEDDITTIVGYLPFVSQGDSLKIIGKFVEHKSYGRQFKIDTFEKLMPKTLGALERYLANGNIKGVGEKIAKRIINKFGDETISVLRDTPLRLAEIKGISESRAKEISESFIEKWEVWQIVGFLDRFGIGAEYAKKVYDLLGINAIEEIKKDPYILIDIARGVDFKQIDKMALDIGITYNEPKRVESGIKFVLISDTYNGNSCTKIDDLIQFVVNLLDVNSEDVEDGLINLKAKGEIILKEIEEEQYIYLEQFFNTELEIAFRMKRLQEAKNMKKISKIENMLEKFEDESKLTLSEKQKQAIKAINDDNVVIITGGPGTGKTTIIKTIIDIYEEKGYKVVLAAPTRKSSKEDDRNNKQRSINTS